MAFDGFQIAALVHALRLHRAASKRTLPSGFGQSSQRGFGIGDQHAQHAVQVAVVEGVAGALQLVVVGEDLLGAGYVARGSFEFNGVGSQVDVDVQAVFQHVQVFVAGAEQGLDVGADFNTLLHSVFAHPSVLRLRVAFRAPVLRWRRGDTGTRVPVSATTKFFSLQVEPTGMLAPGVQATTIELRVRRGSDGSQWWRQVRGEMPIYAPSPLASATEAGTARARAQFLSSWNLPSPDRRKRDGHRQRINKRTGCQRLLAGERRV